MSKLCEKPFVHTMQCLNEVIPASSTAQPLVEMQTSSEEEVIQYVYMDCS